MAFLPIELDEEENDEPANGMSLSGPMGATGGAPAPAPLEGAQPPGGTGGAGQFVNFSQYIAANGDSAKRTAQGLGADVEKAGAEAQKGLGAAQQKFGAGVTAGSPFGAPGSLPTTATAQAMTSGRTARPVAATAPTRAVQTVGSAYATPSNAGARAQSQQTYSGPGQLAKDAGWGKLLENAKDAESRANLLGGGGTPKGAATPVGQEEGIQALLEEKVSGPYSKGQSKFDAALVQNAGGRDFAALKSKYGGLSKMLTDANAASMGQAADARLRTGEIAGRFGQAADEYDVAKSNRTISALRRPALTTPNLSDLGGRLPEREYEQFSRAGERWGLLGQNTWIDSGGSPELFEAMTPEERAEGSGIATKVTGQGDPGAGMAQKALFQGWVARMKAKYRK